MICLSGRSGPSFKKIQQQQQKGLLLQCGKGSLVSMNVADACLKKLELAGCPELRVLPWQSRTSHSI
jgi:hypothetical protein